MKAFDILATVFISLMTMIFMFPLVIIMATSGYLHLVYKTLKAYIKSELMPREYDPSEGVGFGPGEYNLEEIKPDDDLIGEFDR